MIGAVLTRDQVFKAAPSKKVAANELFKRNGFGNDRTNFTVVKSQHPSKHSKVPIVVRPTANGKKSSTITINAKPSSIPKGQPMTARIEYNSDLQDVKTRLISRVSTKKGYAVVQDSSSSAASLSHED